MKHNILVADSDKDTFDWVVGELRDCDVECHWAVDDNSAYSKFMEKGPDVIIASVMLPRKGGFSLVEKIRKAKGGSEVTVFFISMFGNASKMGTEALEIHKAQGLFKKPSELPKLSKTLKKLFPQKSDKPDVQPNPLYMEVPVSGDFTQMSLPMILASVAFGKEPARLALAGGKTQKISFWSNGELEFCLSNLISETLGRQLLNEGLINEVSYKEAIGEMLATKRKMGEILVGSGAISQEEIDRAVHKNVLEKFLEVFSWRQGFFKILPYENPPIHVPGNSIFGVDLLRIGIFERIPVETIQELFSPYTGRKLVAGPAAESANQNPFVATVSSRIQNLLGKSLGEATDVFSNEEVLRSILFLFLLKQLALDDGCVDEVCQLDPNSSFYSDIEMATLLLARLRNKNHFQIIGVGPLADDATVKNSYRKLASIYHPDNLGPNAPPMLVHLHSEILATINDSYESINTADKRRRYFLEVETGKSEMATAENALNAEAIYQDGLSALARKNWKVANAKLTEAARLNPHEPEYLVSLGKCLMNDPGIAPETSLDEAEAYFTLANKYSPNSAEPLYFLGKIALKRGKPEAAAVHFQRAHQRDPKDPAIEREIRLLHMRFPGRFDKILGRPYTA